MASDARSRTSTSAKSAIKNRRDMADTLLYPCGSHAPCRRSEGSRAELHTLIPLDFQGKSGIPGPSRTYPELFALMGGKVPDLRGLFLRGHGGNSAGLGTRQDESVYIAPGSAQISIASQIYVVKAGYPGTAGNHDRPVGVDVLAPRNADGGSGTFQIKGPMSITSSANETRPANQAVRYLVRARP